MGGPAKKNGWGVTRRGRITAFRCRDPPADLVSVEENVEKGTSA